MHAHINSASLMFGFHFFPIFIRERKSNLIPFKKPSAKKLAPNRHENKSALKCNDIKKGSPHHFIEKGWTHCTKTIQLKLNWY